MQQTTRRYDLDWLRTIAFSLLILYHTGMLYVADWGFHYKSQYQSDILQYVMLTVNPWRMPLLFFISGSAVRYVLKNKTLMQGLVSRTWRLLLPLLFGVVAIVPIQLFVEMKSAGVIDFGFIHFYRIFFDLDHPAFTDYQSGILPHIDVNHLWYLRELWQFSLVLIALHPVLKRVFFETFLDRALANPHIHLVLLSVPVLLCCLDLLLFPESQEGQRIARGFCFFVIGYLIHENVDWWQTLIGNRRLILFLALTISLIFLGYYGLIWLEREEPLPPLIAALEKLFIYTNRWFSLLAVFAYAATYLNKQHVILYHWSRAVYPSYVVHQSLLIAICFYLTPFELGAILEVLIVISATTVGCAGIYLTANRVGIFGELIGVFGAKITGYKNADLIVRSVLWPLVIALGLKIL